MPRITYFLSALLLSLCACDDDSTQPTDMDLQPYSIVGLWRATSGQATLNWYKLEQDTIARQYEVVFDSLEWSLQIDSSSYSLNVAADTGGVSNEFKEAGSWMVSVSNPGRIRFIRTYAMLLSHLKTVVTDTISGITGTRIVSFGYDLTHSYWDCKATVAGEQLKLTGIDTSFLEIPVESVTFTRE